MAEQQMPLFPESATVVDERKRKPKSAPRTQIEWRKLGKIKGLRPVCGVCAAERWNRKRAVVNHVRFARVATNGEVTEFCSEHAIAAGMSRAMDTP